MPNAKRILANSIEFAPDAKSALKGADCCIVITEWDEFRRLKAKDCLACCKAPNPADPKKEPLTQSPRGAGY